MKLQQKLADPSLPVTFFELVPPEVGKTTALAEAVDVIRGIVDSVDAINLPEIHNESRPGPRTAQFVPRLDPRLLGARLRDELGTEVVSNHCVVYEPDPLPWLRETQQGFGIEHLVLVGGES